ncbi:MAG TPA: ATP-dependent Clp protease adaptor ClpS [bacterium]|nr:ATP-dependent Clp protease adaptor ClpS [bacterium]
MTQVTPRPQQVPVTDPHTQVDPPWQTILFNDEVHTFDQVILQLQKATGCSLERAFELTLRVHQKGKASVYFGTQEKCLRVSSVLEMIGLATQVEKT